MAQSIRCPHCGKTYVLKPELAGKQVRCRQCQKAFTVPAAKPPDGLEEPIVLSLAPAEPPAATSTPLGFNQRLANGPTIARPDQGDPLEVGSFLPMGAAPLRPVAARRGASAGQSVWQRLAERKLTAAVAVVSVGLLFVTILLFFATGLSVLFVIPAIAGAMLAGVGLVFPVPTRRKRKGPTLAPAAVRIAVGTGVVGVVLAVVFGIMVVAGLCGHPIPPMFGMAPENAVALLLGILWGVGVCFGACLLTVLLAAVWSLARQHGFLPVFNFLYLGASPLILLVLCVCGIASKWMRDGPPVAYHPPAQRTTNAPPGWPQDSSSDADDVRSAAEELLPGGHPVQPRAEQQHSGAEPTGPGVDPMNPGGGPMPPGVGPMGRGPRMGRFPMPPMGPVESPPGAENPGDPNFYRVNLAELRSSDVNRRRFAVARLSRAQPKELREEISKVLESLVNDSDVIVRAGSLMALSVWSTGDVVPIAVAALKDSNIMVRSCAIELLEQHKDARAIEPLVELLSDPMNARAAHCLERMGSMVEDALLAHFDAGNDAAKRSIVQILGAVATEKGIAKLREIAADKSNISLASQARVALMRRGRAA